MVRSFFGIAMWAIVASTVGTASAQDAPPATPAPGPTTITATATVTVSVGPADALGSPVIVAPAVPAAAPAVIVVPAAPAAAPPVIIVPDIPPPPSAYSVQSFAPGAAPTAAPLVWTTPAPVDTSHTRSRFGRIMAEAGLGLAGMAGGALGGLVLGFGICGSSDSSFSDDCTGAVVAGLLLGAGIGTPLGIFAAGSMIDGNGGFGWTLLGTTAGFLLGSALVSAAQDEGLVWIAAATPVLGGILAYELSSDPSARAAEARAQAAQQVRASIGPTRGGVSVALSGTF